MERKTRLAAVAAIFAAAAPMPAQAQDLTPWEECIIQCAHDYGGGTQLYRLCREYCTRTYGGPQLVQIEIPGKRD